MVVSVPANAFKHFARGIPFAVSSANRCSAFSAVSAFEIWLAMHCSASRATPNGRADIPLGSKTCAMDCGERASKAVYVQWMACFPSASPSLIAKSRGPTRDARDISFATK